MTFGWQVDPVLIGGLLTFAVLYGLLFPPTATGPQSMTTWAGLSGLPLSVAIIVTALLLRRAEAQETAEGQAGPAGERA